jgi:hypothetical protein
VIIACSYSSQSCGYRGNDTFMEYRAGAIDELARRLEVAGVVILVELLGLSDPFLDAIKMFLVHISIFFLNILLDLDRTFRSRSGGQADCSPTGVQVNPSGNHPATDSPKNSPLKTPPSKRAHDPSSSSSQPSGQSSSSGIPLITSSSATPRASTTSSPVTADYVLLCINDSKLLVTRDDLDLTPVVSDKQLFTCFRTRYFPRRNWSHKVISLKSLQNITFVKVNGYFLRPYTLYWQMLIIFSLHCTKTKR